MKKSEICIIIPIYKEILNDFEMLSVNQCIEMLSDYSLNFVCPLEINIDFYQEKFPEIKNFIFFEKDFFESIKGYNRLMLNRDFYKAFDKFEYMLIYQTDCYVFRDELLDWAIKGYDYIGGVWFEDYHGNPNLQAKLWYPGNGGLSLRKIKTMINILRSTQPVKSFKMLFDEKMEIRKNGKINFLKELFLLPLNIFGYKNSFKYFALRNEINEDVFFMEASLLHKKLNVPMVEEAIDFSWDRSPAFLFNKLGYLPFACHAWHREDHCYVGNRKFWTKHINCD